jgi:hypothetical protein
MPGTSGYSGTPLVKKLGWTPEVPIVLMGAPPDYARWLGPEGRDLVFATRASRATAAAHLFVTRRAALQSRLTQWRGLIAPAGMLWVSWPKQASGVATDITEDVIRAVALPMGWVDVKVCAVTEVWSGLKLVIRKEQRP